MVRHWYKSRFLHVCLSILINFDDQIRSNANSFELEWPLWKFSSKNVQDVLIKLNLLHLFVDGKFHIMTTKVKAFSCLKKINKFANFYLPKCFLTSIVKQIVNARYNKCHCSIIVAINIWWLFYQFHYTKFYKKDKFSIFSCTWNDLVK